MNMMKTCPICAAKAVKGAKTCYECYYRFSDQSTRNVNPSSYQVPLATPRIPQFEGLKNK